MIFMCINFNVWADNTHTPETVTINGTTTWVDNNDQDGIRPDTVTIILLANGTEVDRKTVNATDDWSFTNYKNQNGEEITYTITQEEVEGYTTTVNGFNITLRYAPGTGGQPGMGDNFKPMVWISIMILSLVGLIVTEKYRRKLCKGN